MNDILARIAQHNAQQTSKVESELHQLLSGITPDKHSEILRARIHELHSDLAAAESNYRLAKAVRPTLIQLVNLVAGASLGAVSVYVALTTSVLTSKCFF
ncbi:hypothetical protein H6F51_23780 [Cyanobacteria bacterium FACHB-DQ100]|nr:hypothetical protein [Cyanobacteria bacterium FACHB-DQ100]